MNTVDLEELAARIMASLTATAEEALFFELFPPTLDLLARGKPVSVEEIAAAAGKSPEEVQLAMGQVDSVDRDEQGRIVGAGLSLVPTPHRFEVEGRTLFTWCALDALGFPVILGRPASIESPCRGTGEPVHIEVTPTEVVAVEPPSAVVSVVVPQELANVRGVVCENVHFFSSPEAASRWLERHPEATILPVDEAFRLGRLIAEGILDISRSADTQLTGRGNERL